MEQLRCDICNTTFNSRMNYEHHRDLVDCAPSETDDASRRDEHEREQSGNETPWDLPLADATGTVVDYDADRGFGFVTTQDLLADRTHGSAELVDVFLHVSELDARSVDVGDQLAFDIVEGDEGPAARDATVVERGSSSNNDSATSRRTRRRGFGHEKNDEALGHGKAASSDSDIEDFADERKFR